MDMMARRRAMMAAATAPSGPQWELIGETTIALPEYTNTSTAETIDTGINVTQMTHAFGVVIITCDSAITTTTEWGMTLAAFSRYVPSGNLVKSAGGLQQKGCSSLSHAGMTQNAISQDGYGVVLVNNTATVKFSRKAHVNAMPKIRGGNYTIKVYGLKSL